MCWNFHLIFLLSSALVRSLVPYCFWNLHKCRFSNYWFFSSRFCFVFLYIVRIPWNFACVLKCILLHPRVLLIVFFERFSLKSFLHRVVLSHIFKLGHLTPPSAFLSHFTEVIESEEHLRSVEVGMGRWGDVFRDFISFKKTVTRYN